MRAPVSVLVAWNRPPATTGIVSLVEAACRGMQASRIQGARPALQVCFGGMQRDLLLYRYKGLEFSVQGDAASAPLPELASDFDRCASPTAATQMHVTHVTARSASLLVDC